MARFKRRCKNCKRVKGITSCELCGGDGFVLKPIKISGIRIALDNRPPEDFQLIVRPEGILEFRQKGKRATVKTTAQVTFNRARMDTAREAMDAAQKEQKPFKVRRKR